jgi:hypothetical protein
MKKTGWIVFNALFQKCSPEAQTIIMSYFDKEVEEDLEQLSAAHQDPTLGVTPEEDYLHKIHFSWFAPYLRTLSENDMRLCLASLSERQRDHLKKNLLLSNRFPTLTPLGEKYLKATLFEHLKGKDRELLPIECLPEYSLNTLLDLSSNDLSSCIDLLGLYDVAIELRQIIETAKLKQLYNAFSSLEQSYLKQLAQQKELITFKKMGLDKWDGDLPQLKSLIHQRGLNRLAKAVYGQEESFLWYLSHRMELSDARMFEKLSTDLKNPSAIAMLNRQIIHLVQFIREKKDKT